MSSVTVKRRAGKTGERFLVYYRLGGRRSPQRYAGSFQTEDEAGLRRALVAEEIAAGRDPAAVLDPAPAAAKRYARLTASRSRVLETLAAVVPPPEGTTTVYLVRSKGGVLLYGGVTGRRLNRFHEHARRADWWGQAASIELRHYSSRADALADECRLVRELSPRFNLIHAGGGPVARAGDGLRAATSFVDFVLGGVA